MLWVRSVSVRTVRSVVKKILRFNRWIQSMNTTNYQHSYCNCTCTFYKDHCNGKPTVYWFTCVMGDSEGDMVGDSCLDRPLRCSVPGDKVRGLMGAGRRRGELPERRRDELMEGLLSDDWSWQLLRDAWIEGLLREEDSPAGTTKTRGEGGSSDAKSLRAWMYISRTLNGCETDAGS